MTNSQPVVSVGMPVYNSEQHMRQALESLLRQDWEDLELVISDNASTDGTRDICLEYAARDRRIRYYRNERNMGITWNLNRVFELSSGLYFKWAGSHDYVSPSFITACKQILDSDPSVVLAYPLARLVDSEGQTIIETVPEFVDTRGLPTCARVRSVVEKVDYCAIELYGLFRASDLRRCRRLWSGLGNDHILMMEISFLGAIAMIPEVLFFRREFGPTLKKDKRIATLLIRNSPDYRGRKRVRPYWEMGIQHLIGAWRLAPRSTKFHVLPLLAYTFYLRWHGQLKRELLQPYSLQSYIVPDY
jgi:glycosyltransferase involved in cell wall biosynthesis